MRRCRRLGLQNLSSRDAGELDRHAVDVGVGIVELPAIGETDIGGVGGGLGEQANLELVRDIGEHFKLRLDAAVLLEVLPAMPVPAPFIMASCSRVIASIFAAASAIDHLIPHSTELGTDLERGSSAYCVLRYSIRSLTCSTYWGPLQLSRRSFPSITVSRSCPALECECAAYRRASMSARRRRCGRRPAVATHIRHCLGRSRSNRAGTAAAARSAPASGRASARSHCGDRARATKSRRARSSHSLDWPA